MNRRLPGTVVGLTAALLIVALCVFVLLLTVTQLPVPPIWVPDVPPTIEGR